MHIVHCRRYHAMALDVLHLGQMPARLEKIRCACMPKLVRAVDRHLGTAGDGMNAVAGSAARHTPAVAVHKQSALSAPPSMFQRVVVERGA